MNHYKLTIFLFSTLNSNIIFQFPSLILSLPTAEPTLMFKQHNSTASTFSKFAASNSTSQHSSLSKPSSDIHNFSKLLKKLETENVNIDELKLLKTQHTYLEKLRNQRQKIEDLKLKYTESEQQLTLVQQQNKAQSILLRQYEQTIEILKDQLEAERERRLQLESTIGTKLEAEKDKMKLKIGDLTKEVEELKRVIKNKDILVMQLEQEAEEKVREMKQHFSEAKRKLVAEIQQRLSKQLQQKSQFEGQVLELRNLVTRQNKALKQQNQKYQQLSQSHNKLVEQLEKCHSQITNLTLACEEYEEKLNQAETTNHQLISVVKELNHNQENNGQLEELRKRMAQMAKGEIEKIEFIVNEFQ